MSTLSVSLPSKLKAQAKNLVQAGYYSSLSDIVRSALRDKLKKSRHEFWVEEAKKDLKNGDAIVIKNSEDIEKLFE